MTNPSPARLAEEAERARFEAEAVARSWAYRTDHGLRFYPSHEGGGDLWKGWLAARSTPTVDEAAEREKWMETFTRPTNRTFLRNADGTYVNSCVEYDWQAHLHAAMAQSKEQP